MFLGPNVWDPWQIIAQIVAVQCLYYLSYGLLLWGLLGETAALIGCSLLPTNCAEQHSHLNISEASAAAAGPYVDGLELKHLFDWRWLTLHEFRGWMLATGVVLNSILAALYIMVLVSSPLKLAPLSCRCHLMLFLVQKLPVGQPGVTSVNKASASLEAQVQRAKKCLDFSATIYILHFAAVAAYAGFPKRLEW